VRVAGLARWFAVVELVALVVFLLALNPFINYRALNPTSRIFFVYPLRDVAPFIIIASVLLLAVFSYLGVLGVKGIDPGRAGRRLVMEYMAGCLLVSALSIIEAFLLAVLVWLPGGCESIWVERGRDCDVLLGIWCFSEAFSTAGTALISLT